MKIRGFLVTDGPKAKGLKPNKKESWVLGPTTRSHSLCPIKKLIGLKAQLPHYIKKEKKRRKRRPNNNPAIRREAQGRRASYSSLMG